jgi:tyrosyl-tRNA synthetase
MPKNFIEEFRWRGMLQEITPGLEEWISEKPITGYIGFDPTANSLHIGSLATVLLLVHLQRAGHSPIALVGGATGMIGDPSGKSAERNLLDAGTISANTDAIRKQLEKFLDFSPGPQQAQVVNNLDWFGSMSAIDFLRNIGKHLTINYMLAKESVQKRMETGISFTEFSYQLIQGYDFCWLYQNKGVLLQMGGSDQWGNMTAGTELVRRMTGGEVFAVTTPLVTKSDGSKFGKTEGGNIWLDPNLTSPYQFFQFWLNQSDADAPGLIRRFTFLQKQEIESLEKDHALQPEQRILQKKMAEEVTRLVHGQSGLETALLTTGVLFGKGELKELESISEEQFHMVIAGVPRSSMANAELNSDWTHVLSAATGNQIFPSKSEARKMIAGGGVQVNKQKISSPEIAGVKLLRGKYLLVQKGKKNYFLIETV